MKGLTLNDIIKELDKVLEDADRDNLEAIAELLETPTEPTDHEPTEPTE